MCSSDLNSFSTNNDFLIGTSLLDRFTYHMLQFLSGLDVDSRRSVQDFLDMPGWSRAVLDAGALYRRDLYPERNLAEVPVTSFFAEVTHPIPLKSIYDL